MFRKILLGIFTCVLFSALSFTSIAQEAGTEPTYQSARDIPMEVFAQLPKVEKASLSPNGRYLAIVYPVQGEAKFYIFDLAKENPEPPKYIGTGEVDIIWIEWLSNDRVLINYGFYVKYKRDDEGWYETRLLAFNRDGGHATKIGEWGKSFNTQWAHISKKAAAFYIESDNIISFLPDDPRHILIQVKLPGLEDFGVFKVDVYSGKLEQVQDPIEPVMEWYADHEGNVRFGTGWDDGTWVFLIRASVGAPWKKFDKTEIFEDGGFEPLYFGFEHDILFVRASINTGRETIYKYNLTTGAVEEKIFEHPEYDAGSLVISVKDKKILAASYTDDYPTLHFFDEEYEKMDNQITQALGGKQFVYLDSTRDRRFHIIRSYSSSDPGTLYWYDHENKELSPIWEVMPGLDPTLMSEVKKVDYMARDGLELTGYLTLPKESGGKNLPTIMLIHGGPWSRDDMGFDAKVQFLASRGYAVFQPNFRGSSGFGDRFEVLGYGEWGKSMQTDITDGLNWLVKQGITDPDQVCIAGGSYGGYAALMGVAQNSDLYKCAFAFAPVTDIDRLLDDAGKKGTRGFYKKTVTPGMKKKEIESISPIEYIKQITSPILLIHGDEDSRVNIKHSEKMAKALKKKKKDFKFITLEGAPHGIPEEKYRFIYYGELEKFLARNLRTASPAPKTE